MAKPKYKDKPLKRFQLAFNGMWKPGKEASLLKPGDFLQLINMRYTRYGIRSIHGTTNITASTVPSPEGPTIGYTTTQMPTDGTQDLWVTGGNDPYTWTITSGGGTIDPTGASVTYTAPSTNPSCAYNPTIQVTDAYGRTDTLTIAVHAISPYNAVIDVQCIPIESCDPGHCCNKIVAAYVNCDGTAGQYVSCLGCSCSESDCNGDTCDPIYKPCTCASIEGSGSSLCGHGANPPCSDVQMEDNCAERYIDIRTEQMIIDGCCPEQLL